MKTSITSLACLMAGITSLATLLAQEPYQPTWESLDRHKMPQWYDDAKIGLSMHWGVYSVPAWAPREKEIAYAEWYGNRMKDPGNPTFNYHQQQYGTNHPYDQFIPTPTATR